MLYVAQSAKVMINNRPTKASGDRRVYLSRLEPGASYRFQIQVEDRGKVVQRDVILKAGETKTFELHEAELASL